MGNGQFEMGDHSYGTIQVVGKVGRIVVGKFCSIADNVSGILVGHRVDWVSTYPFGAREIRKRWPTAYGSTGHPQEYGDIVIENDVWIGQNATILGGVTIGNGAVIAASSVVAKNVPPYALVGGVPAIVLKYRFRPDQIKALLKIAWWDWTDEVIDREVKSISNDDIDGFIRRFA